jgi:hypothetical protein
VEQAIDRATSAYADRIVSRWQDWLRSRPPADVLEMLSALTSLSADEARQEAAETLDRHLLDVRPEDRSFALDYIASIPAQIKQALIFDRDSRSYRLPANWSSTSIEALRRFLPVPEEMKSAWGRGGAKEPYTPQFQSQPDAPRTVLPVATVPPVLSAGPAPALRRSSLVPKLRVLLRAHRLAHWARRQRAALNAALLAVCGLLGAMTGSGVFWSLYKDPQQHAQIIHDWDQFGRQTTTYFIENQKVTQQEYQYYLNTNRNDVKANFLAVLSGLGVFGALFGLGTWLLWRHPSAVQRILDDQIKTIVETNPDEVKEWGGQAVLRQRGLVAEILGLEEKGLA